MEKRKIWYNLTNRKKRPGDSRVGENGRGDRGYVCALAKRYRIRMLEPGLEKAGMPIRELTAGFPAKGSAGTFEEPLLLMDHFNEQQFNGFLDDLNQCTPAFRGFKAIVTRSNRQWTVSALVEELRREKASLEQSKTENRETEENKQ